MLDGDGEIDEIRYWACTTSTLIRLDEEEGGRCRHAMVFTMQLIFPFRTKRTLSTTSSGLEVIS